MNGTEFGTLVAKIGVELGMRPDPAYASHGRAAGITDGECGYRLASPGADGKIGITPMYPETSYYFRAGEAGWIGVAASRGPKVIAGEIRRRLDPVYADTLAKVTFHNAAVADDAARRAALASEIAGLFPPATVSVPEHRQRGGIAEVNVRGPGWVKIKRDASEVEFERFGVPAEAGVAMLAAYAKWLAAQDTP
jgi:hypothetical protein